jgi:hypothetical protein
MSTTANISCRQATTLAPDSSFEIFEMLFFGLFLRALIV